MYSPPNLNNIQSSVSVILRCLDLEYKESKKVKEDLPNIEYITAEFVKMPLLRSLFDDFENRDTVDFAYNWTRETGYNISKSGEGPQVSGEDPQEKTITLPRGGIDEEILEAFITSLLFGRRQIITRCQKLKRSIPAIRRKQNAFDALMGDFLTT
jgi:hypothetical protein